MASTEPDAGSDVAAITTTAVKDGDDYGSPENKMFIANRTIGIPFSCLRDGPDEAHRKHTTAERLSSWRRTGRDMNELASRKVSIRCRYRVSVAFKEVRVPRSNLVGKEGKGFYQLMEFFNRARIEGGGALAIGTAQGALDKAIDHVKKRKAFGGTLARLQVVQAKIAEMATLVEAGRSLYWRAAMMVDRGVIDPSLIAMSKWYTCEIAVKVADEAIQLHGGYGILEEYDVEHY